jgi:hypothetical protein
MISPGLRVRVVIPEGCRDPWICQKDGWRGDVAAAADDIGPGFWRVRFAPPWCELGILRVMQGDVLAVVEDSAVTRGNPVKGMAVGAWVKVKDNAGASDGEEHIRRKRGRIGTIIRECVMASSCVEVEFPGAMLPVMIPRGDLRESSAPPVMAVKQKAGGQMRLPM